MNWMNQINLQRELWNPYRVTLQSYHIRPYIYFADHKIKKKGMSLPGLENSTPAILFLLCSLLCTFSLTMAPNIDVVYFCNGNCNVAKVVVPPRKGKQEHIKCTNNMWKNIIET